MFHSVLSHRPGRTQLCFFFLFIINRRQELVLPVTVWRFSLLLPHSQMIMLRLKHLNYSLPKGTLRSVTKDRDESCC